MLYSKDELITEFGFDEHTAGLLMFAFNTGESPSKLIIEANELKHSAVITHEKACNETIKKYQALYIR